MVQSPELAGGAGFTFADQVAARYLAALLLGSAAQGLTERQVVRVALEQRDAGEPLDDLVVDAVAPNGSVARLSLQVKREITISAGPTNTDFRDIIRDSWATIDKPNFRAGVDRLVSACAPISFSSFTERSTPTETVVLNDPQACAIGYDLAKSIYEAVPAGRTEIGVRKATGECERHAIEYLRRSGFAISETGGAPFTVETRALGGQEVLAVGRVGNNLSISRIYELAPMGVFPVTPATLRKSDGRALERAALGPRRRLAENDQNSTSGDR